MKKYYEKLKTIFSQLYELEHLINLAAWDEAVMMPKGGGAARAKAISMLTKLRHDIISSPKIKHLLKHAEIEEITDPWDQANLRWMRKLYFKASALPSRLIEKISQQNIRCEQLWRDKRPINDWQGFVSSFQHTIDLVKHAAEIRSQIQQQSPYDVLLDDHAPNISKTFIEPIFSELTSFLPSFTHQVVQKQQQIPIIPITGPFHLDKQKSLSVKLMKAIGFDFKHGRLDISHHPFCSGVPDDVRITTHFNKDDLFSGIMGVVHETGHAMYDRGLPLDYNDQPVGQAPDMSLHESQSLLVEMQACRSRSFIEFLTPLITHYFGEQPGIEINNIYRISTRVHPSLIRIYADEVTYPLHVIMRYEIEKQLIENNLKAKELPEMWDFYMQKFFGLSTKNNFMDGVMQDAHWPAGLFGYFPAYTLGALMAAQFYQRVSAVHPELNDNLAKGNFSILVAWLKQNIHAKASSISSQEILKQATGEALNPKYFIQHLKKRYS